jgi:hypothetical protein
MKNAVFWDVAPCRSCGLNRRFGGRYRFHLQGRKISERGFSTLKMEGIRSSEMSVQSTRSTQCHIPEEGILHSYVMFLYIYVLMGNPHNFKTTTMLSATSVLPTIAVYFYEQNSKSKVSRFLVIYLQKSKSEA